MKRIDFLGAPGVGKSTIYHELVRQRTKLDTWMTPEEARTKTKCEYSLQNARSVKEHAVAGLLKNGVCIKLLPSFSKRMLETILDTYQFDKYERETIWVEKERYADFFNVALKSATIEEKEPLRRLMGITHFYSVARDVIFLEHSSFPGLVLFDESLSLRVYGITRSRKGFFESATEDYFNNIPLPAGLIYCSLDPEKTFQRIKQRSLPMPGQHGKIIPGHRDLESAPLLESIEVQLDKAAIGADVLRNRGVKVLDIDMKDSLTYNVNVIANALRGRFE